MKDDKQKYFTKEENNEICAAMRAAGKQFVLITSHDDCAVDMTIGVSSPGGLLLESYIWLRETIERRIGRRSMEKCLIDYGKVLEREKHEGKKHKDKKEEDNCAQPEMDKSFGELLSIIEKLGRQ